jgi:hypothetical protein
MSAGARNPPRRRGIERRGPCVHSRCCSMRLPLPLTIAAALGAVVAIAAVPARAGVLISIDKSAQRMSVIVDGEPRYSWPVSTGRVGYSTPSGAFTPFRLEEDHYSEEWDNAPMPHSIFFTRQGHAIHGSFETRRLGTPASAGCVRLAPPNAAKLFALVKAEGLANTKVVLSGTEPAVARRAAARPQVQRRPAREAAARPIWRDGYGDPLVEVPGRARRGADLYGRAPGGWYGPGSYAPGWR